MELEQRHLRELRRVARSGILVLTEPGADPEAVVRVAGPGEGLAYGMSARVFGDLRSEGLVEWEQGEGRGPWPLRLSQAGVYALTFKPSEVRSVGS